VLTFDWIVTTQKRSKVVEYIPFFSVVLVVLEDWKALEVIQLDDMLVQNVDICSSLEPTGTRTTPSRIALLMFLFLRNSYIRK
jgi:hypothetical protein